MQFTVASGVYFVSSTFFPAKETYLDEAILPDDTALDAGYDAKSVDDEHSLSMAEKASLQADVKSTVDQDA